MERFECRGVSIDVFGWVFGELVNKSGKMYLVERIENKHTRENGIVLHIVFEETIGCYTGVNDISGMRIYTGDIVEIYSELKQKWNIESETVNENFLERFKPKEFKFKLVGNIFEEDYGVI